MKLTSCWKGELEYAACRHHPSCHTSSWQDHFTRKQQAKKKPKVETTTSTPTVTRKLVEKEDTWYTTVLMQLSDSIVCSPICLDELADSEMTWCQYGCGNNIHNDCLQHYAQHALSIGKPVKCPVSTFIYTFKGTSLNSLTFYLLVLSMWLGFSWFEENRTAFSAFVSFQQSISSR